MKLDRSSSPVLRELCRFALFFAVAAAAFSGYYQKWHFAEADMPGEHSRASFEGMVDGTAYRPYVYRQLLPALANFAERVTPGAVKQRVDAAETGSDPFLYAISVSPTVQNPKYTLRYLALYLLTFLSALAAVYAMFLVCRELGAGEPGRNFAPVVLILLLPYIMSVGGFFYDFPELALMALAVLAVLRWNWWWAIPIVALGEWNKETFLFFVVALYPFLRGKNSPARSWVGVGVLCAVAAGVYLGLRARYAQNPGGTVEVWWLAQLRYLIHPRDFLFSWEETYGIPAPKIYTLFPMALLAWVVWRGWRFLPAPVRRHAVIAAAINLPLYFVFAFPGELRDLSMLYVALLAMLACLINVWSGAEPLRSAQGAPAAPGC
jgi:hypothetical protein